MTTSAIAVTSTARRPAPRITDHFSVARLDKSNYVPSKKALLFHQSLARFRFLIWGIKSGKTHAGAFEFVRALLGSPPNTQSWLVTPNTSHLAEAEKAIMKILAPFPELLVSRNRHSHEFFLVGGRSFQGKNAERPDNLRGPNIDGLIWCDEAAFMKEDSHYVLRERVAATGAPMIYTTTPESRNWLWTEVQLAGMPPDMPYGVFGVDKEEGGYFVSHYPTWDFPFVSKAEIQGLRLRTSKIKFDQELGAMFLTSAARALHHVEEAFTRELPPKEIEGTLIMGLDLARYQDWSAVVIMAPDGRVIFTDRWNDTEWSIQRPRIYNLAQRFKAVIMIDKANVGSVIEEDLRDAGLDVMAIDMNSPDVKNNLVQTLQLSLEHHSIRIPDPKSDWATDSDMQLYKELIWLECSITERGRLSFTVPRGLTDDLCVALCLANWGRARAVAGGIEAGACAISGQDWGQVLDEDDEKEDKDDIDFSRILKLRSNRPDVFKNIFSGSHSRSAVGFEFMGDSVWSTRSWDS